MNQYVLPFIEALIQALGEQAESAGVWKSIAPWLTQFGATVGLGQGIMDAINESSNLAEFYARLQANIVGGDVGAAIAVVAASAFAATATGGAALEAVVTRTAGAITLPEALTVIGATAAALGATFGAAAADALFTVAYGGLVQAFTAATAPPAATWQSIGNDTSGNSLLADAIFNPAVATALGLSDSTMLAACASSAESNTPTTNGSVPESSLLSDANFLGAAVAANEIGAGASGVLSGNAVTEALCEILVQFAGDQAEKLLTGPDFNIHPAGDFGYSTNSVLSVDLNLTDWSTTYAQASPTIVGVQPLLDAISDNVLGAGTSTAWVDNYLLQNNPSLIQAALTSGATLSDSQATTSYMSSTANAVLIGQNDTTINAGNDDDVIIGGQNVTVGNGNNIIIGTGQGGETINVGTGSNLIYAAGSGNTININPAVASVDAPLPNPGINIIYAGTGGDLININYGQSLAGIVMLPVTDLSESNVLNLNQTAFIAAIDSEIQAWCNACGYDGAGGGTWPAGGFPLTPPGEVAPGLPDLTAGYQEYESTSYDTDGLSGFDWTVLLYPESYSTSSTPDSLEFNSGQPSTPVPGQQYITAGSNTYPYYPLSNQAGPTNVVYAPDGFTNVDYPSGGGYYGIVYTAWDGALGGFGADPVIPALDLADYQEPDLNPPPQQTQPTQPTQPQQPTDPGPTANLVSDTIGHGQTIDLTSALLAAVTPGLPGDVLTITGVSGAQGQTSVNNGDVQYTAPASGVSADDFTYTVADQLGDQASGAVDITIDPGPTAGAVADALDVGQSLDLTSAILSAATPGLPGDVLSITDVDASGTIGTVSFANGDVSYDASSADFASLAANASESDSFSYTLTDQLGDVATGVVDLTIDNPVTMIAGPSYGGGTIQGVDGAEVINASSYGNVIDANGGSGTINAGDGNATVDAGAGNLTINLNGYSDNVSGGDGNDSISGSQGNAVIALGDGNDTITTGGYNNSITLGNGDDTVEAGEGNETITLGNGNVSVTASGYNNVINVGNGDDVINAGDGSETVVAGNGDDTINAAGYNNDITVGDGDNTISAGAGSETVVTGSGSNVITAQGYNDQITLGAGSVDNSVTMSNGALNLGAGAAATLTGDDNAIALSSNNTVAAVGANETYAVGANSGTSEIASSPGTNTGTVQFGAGVSDENLWFQQAGNNLQVDVIGANTQLTVDNWFGGSNAARVQSFSAGDLEIDRQLGLLIQAMATFGANNPAFNPATATQMPNDPSLQSVIAAAWHG